LHEVFVGKVETQIPHIYALCHDTPPRCDAIYKYSQTECRNQGAAFVICGKNRYKLKKGDFMSMRYIIRRSKPEDLTEIKREVSDLDKQLDKPLENYRRAVEVTYSNLRSAVYQFMTLKNGNEWVWVCPSVELVAESEEGLFALTDKFKADRPAHLGA
jgi:hypothetical protein